MAAAVSGVLVFPFIWGLTEPMTYNGYLVPRFQVPCRSTGRAVAIVAFVWSSQDAAMHDGGPGHVEQPTSEQAVIQRGDVETAAREQCPQIDQEGCAKSDKNGGDDMS